MLPDLPASSPRAARSRSPRRPSIIRFCRCSAIPTSPAFASGRAAAAAFRYPRRRAPAARAWRATYMDANFGRRPVGLWPSEGSVSDEVFAHRRRARLPLGRHRQRRAGPHAAARAPASTRPIGRTCGSRAAARCACSSAITYLSDLIGFVYSRMDARPAADDFLDRIRENCRGILASGPRRAGAHHSGWRKRLGILRSTTAGPFCASSTGASQTDRGMRRSRSPRRCERIEPRAARPHLSRAPGSTRTSTSGSAPKKTTRPGSYLLRARETYDCVTARSREQRREAGAYEELLIAEGSDWCWWYGPEHDSANRVEFDQLYRSHLANVYRALGLTPPRRALAAHPAGCRAAMSTHVRPRLYARPSTAR